MQSPDANNPIFGPLSFHLERVKKRTVLMKTLEISKVQGVDSRLRGKEKRGAEKTGRSVILRTRNEDEEISFLMGIIPPHRHKQRIGNTETGFFAALVMTVYRLRMTTCRLR